MAEHNQPATPAQAATPGAQEQNGNGQPAPSNPAPQGAGGVPTNQDGKVTIDLKEYRNLQRQDARAKAYEKRFGPKGRPSSQAASGDQGATVDDQVIAERARAEEAERRALQSEVKVELIGLVNREEYKSIPQSTKDLLLKNPGAITTADTLEDALFDVEEWLNDQASKNPAPTQVVLPGTQPPKHETPPVVSNGAPAPAGADQIEDVSKLHGPAKTQAMIRNAIKTKRQG